jgi:hypothetical protein
VEQVVLITKNAAQACDTGGGQGTRRPQNFRKAAPGRRLLFKPTLSRAGIFPTCGTRFSEQIGCIADKVRHEARRTSVR